MSERLSEGEGTAPGQVLGEGLVSQLGQGSPKVLAYSGLGTFRPEGLGGPTEKKEEEGRKKPNLFPFPRARTVKGLPFFLLQASVAPLPAKAEKGQPWSPVLPSHASAAPNFVLPFSAPDPSP